FGFGHGKAEILEHVHRDTAYDAGIIDHQAKGGLGHEALRSSLSASLRLVTWRSARARLSGNRVGSDLARYSLNPASRPAVMSSSLAWEDKAMSGIWPQRVSLRMASASAKPFRLGISTSLMMTSNCCPSSRSLRASVPSDAVVTDQLADVSSGAIRLRKNGLSSTSRA